MATLKISDWTRTPGLRNTGRWTGEEFRRTKLLPALKSAIRDNDPLLVNLEGTLGYPPSFLEESFGGLIRVEQISLLEALKFLKIESPSRPYYQEYINNYLKEASKLTI